MSIDESAAGPTSGLSKGPVHTIVPKPAIECRNLSFSHGNTQVLNDITFSLPPGSRCVLVGANGAGKSTLLRILGGRHMHDDTAAFILGHNAFRATSFLNHRRQYLDPNWGLRTVAFAGCGVAYQADIPVGEMMQKLQEEFPQRRDELLRMLEIDPAWRMHKLSDGQRRRVQLFLGLIRPFRVILLDEVTAVLDVLCRQRLLEYLRRECDERKCTMIYATHVFDGLDAWSTHILWLRKTPIPGSVGFFDETRRAPGLAGLSCSNLSLLPTVMTWLTGERARSSGQHNAAVGEYDPSKEVEDEAGDAAIQDKSSLQQSNYGAGGFASGRMLGTVTRKGGGFEPGRMYDYW